MTAEINVKCISKELRRRLLDVFVELKRDSMRNGNQEDTDAIDMYMFIVEAADECKHE